MITFDQFMAGRLITNQLLYQLSYEGLRFFYRETLNSSS